MPDMPEKQTYSIECQKGPPLYRQTYCVQACHIFSKRDLSNAKRDLFCTLAYLKTVPSGHRNGSACATIFRYKMGVWYSFFSASLVQFQKFQPVKEGGTYVCAYTYERTHMHAYMHAFIHTCHIHIRIHTHTHPIHTYTHAYTQACCIDTCICTLSQTFELTHTICLFRSFSRGPAPCP